MFKSNADEVYRPPKRVSGSIRPEALGKPVKTRYREKVEKYLSSAEGHVILYIQGRKYTQKAYKSKKQRRGFIARWFEEFGCSIEIGIIPKNINT